MFVEKHLYMQAEDIFKEEVMNAFYGEFTNKEASCVAGFIEGIRFMLKRESFTDKEKIDAFITELAAYFAETGEFRFYDYSKRYE